MKTLATLAAVPPLLALTFGAALANAPAPLTTKIAAVTVYADRAQVTRTGAVELTATPKRVIISGLPGWIDEDSVRATLTPGSGRILDVVVERDFLAEASEEAVRTAEAAVNEINDELLAIGDEEAVLRAEIAQIEAVRAFSLDKLPRDMATRPMKIQDFSETVDFIAATLRKDRKALRDLALRRRTLQPELSARTRARDELLARTQLEKRNVTIEFEGKGRATLGLSYLTPGATWEPMSEMRAVAGGASMSLVQLAQVVQTTGEDWEGAKLAFSTQRPADTLAVPEAQSLLLGAGGAGLGVVLGRMGESFQKAQSTYSAQNRMAARGNSAYLANVDRQMQIQARSTAAFEALKRRGTTAHYNALSDRPIRTDGKPIRVPIAKADYQVTTNVVAVPEVSLNAVQTAQIVNTGDQPILPGRAALFVNGAFVGTSELPFVAPGETFTTYLGVHERVKLGRSLDRKRSKLDRGKRRSDLRVSYIISAENLGDAPIDVDLSDRVPVAEIDDIDVESVRIPKGSKRNADGIVRWTVTLKPGETKRWRIQYDLEYPSNLLTRHRAKRKQAPAPARMLFDDIEQLESML